MIRGWFGYGEGDRVDFSGTTSLQGDGVGDDGDDDEEAGGDSCPISGKSSPKTHD